MARLILACQSPLFFTAGGKKRLTVGKKLQFGVISAICIMYAVESELIKELAMSHFSRPELLKTISKLDALSVDLRQIVDGHEPEEMLLQAAPLIDQWAIVPAPFRVLIGTVTGHPKLPNGEVVTSQLFLIEGGKQWARTFSRYYRLGDMAKRT